MIERARASTGLAIALIEMDFGHVNEAMQEFDQAVAGLQARFDAESGNADLAIELAQLYASWGRTLWRIGRCAEALSCFDKAVARLQRDSHPSLTNDQRNAQDQSYAVLEEFFGEIGLWEEAAKLHHQSLAHTSAPTLGGQWATEAEYRLLLADKEGYRRIALAMSAAANDAGGRDSLIQTLTLVPDAPTPPTAKQLMIWADERRQQAETNNLSIRIFQPAWAAYRAGDYGKTLALLDELKEPFDQYWPLQAMALYQLGRKDEARQRLREIDHWVSETLAPVMTRRTDMRLPGGVHYWEDWLRFFLNYREAVALITGSTQADSPWWRLYRGRLQQILGQPKKADVEFQAAIALRPDDPGLLLARGHLFALEGQWERARADFELAAKLPVDQPRPWIEHGRFLAEHGHHEEADKAFAHAAAIAHDATYPFLEVAWWFVSGYRQDPELPFPPEFEADPARAPAAAVGSGDLAWQSVPVRVGSGPDLRQVIGADARGTAYALAYVYASTPRTVSLSISGNRAIVLWANGERIDGITPGKGFLNADRVPLVLRAGRNTLLVRLTLEGNSTYLHARIHDGAWTRMEQRARLGLWPEAAPEAVQALEEAMIANDPFRARCAIQVARLGGKEAHAVEAAKKFIRRGWLNRDRNHVESVAILNGVFPALNLERSELVACADTLAKASSATSSWLALFAGYAYFRANKLEEASRVAAPEFTDPRFWILRAMIAHQKHEPGEAKRFLAKVDDWYGRQTRKFLDSARLGLPGDGFWFAYAEFLALYEEAKETIEGKPLRDANADQIRAHGLAEWQKLRPELLDFDLAVRLQPDQFRTWLARAQRLYELNRPKEAEADLEQAAQRANDDSAFWRARGRLHLRFGQTEAAAQSFARALEGEQFSSGRSQWFTKAIGLEVGSNEALFQAVTRLRPGEPGLWFNRAQYLVGLGRWKEAAAAYERWYLQVQPEDTYFALDRTALLVQAGDQAGYRRACKELLDRLGPQPSFQRTEQTVKACSLAPGGIEDPLALVPLAEDVVKRSQTEVYYPYFQLALGLAHYRAGQDDAAAPILAALADRKWPAEYREAARALLALVQYRKGELASARRSLNEARSQLHSLIIRLDRGQRYTSTLWRDRLIAQIFLREAEAVIEGNGGRVAETENGRD